MTGADLFPELRGWIDRRVDVAPEARLRGGQSVRHCSERGVTHHEYVYVTVTAQLLACRGAKDECRADVVRQRRQCLTDHVDDAGGLQQECV